MLKSSIISNHIMYFWLNTTQLLCLLALSYFSPPKKPAPFASNHALPAPRGPGGRHPVGVSSQVAVACTSLLGSWNHFQQCPKRTQDISSWLCKIQKLDKTSLSEDEIPGFYLIWLFLCVSKPRMSFWWRHLVKRIRPLWSFLTSGLTRWLWLQPKWMIWRL